MPRTQETKQVRGYNRDAKAHNFVEIKSYLFKTR